MDAQVIASQGRYWRGLNWTVVHGFATWIFVLSREMATKLFLS